MKSEDISSSKASQEKVVTVSNQGIEVSLNLKDFESIMTVFMPEANSKDSQIKLSKEQFSETLWKLLKKGTKLDYVELFEKIDITKEGVVNWDKFVEYMLLDFYEEDEKVKITQVPQWKDLKMLYSSHKESIQHIEFHKPSNRYITVSKEGFVVFWDLQLKLVKSCRLSVETIKQKDLWVTNAVILNNLNKLAVSFTSKEIVIYDLSSKPDFKCLYRIQGLKHTPICMSYWFDPSEDNNAILSFGDVGGLVTAIYFYSAQTSLFERNHQNNIEVQNVDDVTSYIRLKDIPREKSKHSKLRLVQHNIHDGWVRQVRFVDNLGCFISCSTGKHQSVVLGYVDKKKYQMQTTILQHKTGVNCFDYDRSINLIATGTINNQVCLWNPYVISKPIGVLSGHMAPVIQVVVNQKKHQLISFSKDKVLRVWDIQQQMCLQRMAGVFPKGPEVQSILFFDEDINRLFVTFNYQLTTLDMKVEKRDRVVSHERPVTDAIYNPSTNQVISSCQNGVVNIWMIDNGQKVKQFSDCHNSVEVTAIKLNEDCNQFLTGGSDGMIRVWDFNGHCHHQLVCDGGNPAEISQIVMMKRIIGVMGWRKSLTIFRKSSINQHKVSSSDWNGGCEHLDDILCADFHPPTLLVTGSYDGEIIIWDANAETLVKKLCQRSRNQLTNFPTCESHDGSSRPITTDSQTSEIEFSCIISRLILLKHRLSKTQTPFEGADLVSCGGGGWCRFWSTSSGLLLSEFVAHSHCSGIIATTNFTNDYLLTADNDGLVKVWSIKSYLNDNSSLENEKMSAPDIVRSWQVSSDSINSLCFCERMNHLLIIIGSSDCTVSLWTVEGNKIGVFGQEKHWRLDLILESLQMQNNDNCESKNDVVEVESSTFKDFLDELESRCTTRDGRVLDGDDSTDLNKRYDVWEETVLGEKYKEERSKRRGRRQPGKIPGFKRYLESASSPYGSLSCSDLVDTQQVQKPEFVVNPHKYFGENNSELSSIPNTSLQNGQAKEETTISEVRHLLKAAFDEKTFFPRELLEYEAQTRNNYQQKVRLLKAKKKSSGILKNPSNPITSSLSMVSSSLGGVGGSNHHQSSKLSSCLGSTSTITFLPAQ